MRTTSLRAFRLTAVGIAAAVVLFDQLSKAWARTALKDSDLEIVPGFLGLALTENTGAAFGLFRGGGEVIAVLAVVAVGVLIFAFRSVERWWDVSGLGLILGGALGNLLDRLTRGEGLLDGPVTDWIELWFIPNFNVADAAISVGVAALLIGSLRRP